MKHTIAVTGADGFVGAIVVKKLLETGYHVRALIHTGTRNLENLDIQRIDGDVRDIESLYTLCEGCDAVFHLASHISIISNKKEEYKLREVNIEGTKNIINICIEKNIRMVYASSIEAIGKTGNHIHNENDGFNEQCALIRYGWSKALASKEILKACKNDNLDAVIICPTGIAGPFDNGSSKIGQMVKSFIAKNLPTYPSCGGFCFVDVRDVADALIAAYKKAKSGTYYIISSEYADISHIMNLLEEISGVPKPKISIPLWLMYIVASFVEPFSRITNRTPIFTKGSIRILQSRLRVESRAIFNDLQIAPRPLKETFYDQVQWYRGETVSKL